jgi:hypothetical protein
MIHYSNCEFQIDDNYLPFSRLYFRAHTRTQDGQLIQQQPDIGTLRKRGPYRTLRTIGDRGLTHENKFMFIFNLEYILQLTFFSRKS